MAGLFTAAYWPLWTIALALALFLPVRRLIWVLYVRRAQRLGGGGEADQQRLKRRAAVTAALICLIFAYLYTRYVFGRTP
jgi:hypothetical protein